MYTKEQKVLKLAVKMERYFISNKRNDGTKFCCCKDNPQWVTDIIHNVHGNKLPDDTVYKFIWDVLSVLIELNFDTVTEDDLQEAIYTMESDIYTYDLTKWLHAREDHVYYLTQILEECADIKDGFQLLTWAQKAQIEEVGTALINAFVEIDDDTFQEIVYNID